jgi:hypothetical protein
MSQGTEEMRPYKDRPCSQGYKVDSKSPRIHLLKGAIRCDRPQEDIGLDAAGDEVRKQLVLEMQSHCVVGSPKRGLYTGCG